MDEINSVRIKQLTRLRFELESLGFEFQKLLLTIRDQEEDPVPASRIQLAFAGLMFEIEYQITQFAILNQERGDN